MRLYDEPAAGSMHEKSVIFGTENQGVPGEAHFFERFVAARGAGQARLHRDPSYDPSRVEGLGAAMALGITSFGPVVQRTYMERRDFIPSTRSTLPHLAQRFQREGLLREGPREVGMRSFVEQDVSARCLRQPFGRLRCELREDKRVPLEVSNLGELEPRMGVWGHEQRDRQDQWFSPPGPRRLARKNEIVATQWDRTLAGLGDIHGLGDIAASYQVWPSAAEALRKGYGQLFYQGGAIAITTPYGPITIVDADTIYPTAQEALKRGYGFMFQSGAQVQVTGPAGATTINSPKIAAPPPPTPVAQLPPPPPQPGGVFVPPPPTPGSAPPLPAGGTLTNPSAPQVAPTGTVLSTPSGMAVVTPSGALAPAAPGAQPGTGSGYGSGGWGGGGGGGGTSASAFVDKTTAEGSTEPAPAAPGGFFSQTIELPGLGPVPTWGLLAAGAALLWKRSQGSGAGTRRNPKKKGKRKG